MIAIAAATSGVSAYAEGDKFRLITLDPGHFHAALVQKFMYSDVDPLVHVYAPPGDDAREHLKRIEGFNAREEEPTAWRTKTYTGDDYLEKMLAQKPGNIVVIAGNNARKTDYILRSVQSGLHVLADKPMAITPGDYRKLKESFAVAKSKDVLLYDIMTERFEITSILQRALSQQSTLFGELLQGSLEEPAIVKESVHHFSKIVAGAPLVRPQWFFDVRQEGEGIVDVTTHLVDLVQWQSFPGQVLSPDDAKVLNARRWSTAMSAAQFKQVTGADSFPDYLKRDVRDGKLQVYSNGEFTYRLKGVHARIAVTWEFEAPAGAGDTHFSIMRGSKASLTIRQGEAQKYRPVLYVQKAQGIDAAEHEMALRAAIDSLQADYPGIGMRRESAEWAVTVPQQYSVGHEAHFAQVTENFLKYLRDGDMPEWEVPNMLTKYATIMQAYEMSRSN